MLKSCQHIIITRLSDKNANFRKQFRKYYLKYNKHYLVTN